MHVSISKIIRRSKRLSPVKLASSPAKVDKQIPTSQAIVDEAVDTIHDISYDSDAELDLTATAHGTCTSCDRLRKKIKALQKTLSWYKKTKATFQKKLRQLEQTSDSDTRAPCVQRQNWKNTAMTTAWTQILMVQLQWIILLLKNQAIQKSTKTLQGTL